MSQYTTTPTLDMIYLELSQFVSAKTRRELELERQVEQMAGNWKALDQLRAENDRLKADRAEYLSKPCVCQWQAEVERLNNVLIRVIDMEPATQEITVANAMAEEAREGLSNMTEWQAAKKALRADQIEQLSRRIQAIAERWKGVNGGIYTIRAMALDMAHTLMEEHALRVSDEQPKAEDRETG